MVSGKYGESLGEDCVVQTRRKVDCGISLVPLSELFSINNETCCPFVFSFFVSGVTTRQLQLGCL